jgi:hypothetical protein
LPKGIASGISISSNVYMHKASKRVMLLRKCQQPHSKLSQMVPATGFTPTSRGWYCTMMTVAEGMTTEPTLERGMPLLSDEAPATGWNKEPFSGNLVNVAFNDEQGGLIWEAGHRETVLKPEYWSSVKLPGTTLSLTKFFIRFEGSVLK